MGFYCAATSWSCCAGFTPYLEYLRPHSKKRGGSMNASTPRASWLKPWKTLWCTFFHSSSMWKYVFNVEKDFRSHRAGLGRVKPRYASQSLMTSPGLHTDRSSARLVFNRYTYGRMEAKSLENRISLICVSKDSKSSWETNQSSKITRVELIPHACRLQKQSDLSETEVTVEQTKTTKEHIDRYG